MNRSDPGPPAPPLSPALAARLRGMRRTRRWLDPLSRLFPRPRSSAQDGARRIGVLLQWGIGDAVLTLPLLHALHDAWPDAAIEPIGKPFLADLLAGEPGIATCHPLVPPWTRFSGKYRVWDPDWRRYAHEMAVLRRRPFDLLVAPRLDPRDALQARLLSAGETAGFACAGGAGWFTHAPGLPLGAAQATQRGLLAATLAQAITGRTVDPIPRFRHIPDADTAIRRFRERGYRGGPILALAFGASHPVRRWPPDKVAAALRALAGEIGFLVDIRDPGDTEPDIALPPGVPALVWRSGLRDLRAMLSVVSGVFCVDSGVMHIAAACGRPVAAVFGPAEPRHFAPLGDGHRILAATDMPCRPCHEDCPYDRRRCLDAVTVDKAIAAVRGILGPGA